jgi:outer membrane lipoprotein-sorting protein
MKSSTVVAETALSLCFLIAFAAASAKSSQESAPAAQKLAQASPVQQSGDGLEKVLRRMDQTAADFHTAQADFSWTTYNSVANAEVGTDSGKIYFRRTGKETEMMADLVSPSAKQILFADGKVKVYTHLTNEIQVYDTSAHREEVEAFLVLGFGNAGSELKKTFAVTYLRPEKVGDVQTDELELVPTATNVKQQFPKIDLWIDAQGISRRQQLFEQDGDYRTADYSSIKINGKLPGDAFKLKASGGATVVSH